MEQFFQAARFAMRAALDESLPKGEREQWFATALQLEGEYLKMKKGVRK